MTVLGDQEHWIQAEPSWLAHARGLVDETAAALGFDEGCRYEIKVAANEALTNAVEHGAPCEGGRLRLRIEPQTAALTVEVCDCGTFSPPAPSAGDPLPERGRGLDFMRLLMDDVELLPADGGTRLRLRKHLQA